MKKIISIMLSILMIFSCMFVASASDFIDGDEGTDYIKECTCKNHFDTNDSGDYCSCCIFCSNLDAGRKLNCAKKNEETGSYDFCCGNCKGVDPCDCCDCCKNSGEIPEENNGNIIPEEIWGEDDQENFVNAFQSVLKRISDFFDTLFDAIFEFLRIDDVLGNN